MSDINPQDPSGTGIEEPQRPDDFLEGILAEIPEADRPAVEPYFQKWNQSAGAQWDKIHETYKPYKELGSVEELKTARQVMDLINKDPHHVLKTIAENLGLTQEQGLQLFGWQQQQQPTPTPATTPPPVGGLGTAPQNLQGLPPEIQKQLEDQAKLVENLSRAFLSEQAAKKEREEMERLDKELATAKSKYGDFDEEYVLIKMSKGMSIDDAVKAYQTIAGPSKAPTLAPPPLTGGGVVGTQQRIQDMDKKSLNSLVAAHLKAAHQEGT